MLTVTLTPIGGFPGTVLLGCSSLPQHTQCSYNPSTSKPLSGGPQTVRLTVDTSDLLDYGHQVGKEGAPNFRQGKGRSIMFASLLLPMLLYGVGGGASTVKRNSWRRLMLLLLLASIGISLSACSGKLPGSTSPGNYMITVVASDTDPASTLVHTVALNLQVTK